MRGVSWCAFTMSCHSWESRGTYTFPWWRTSPSSSDYSSPCRFPELPSSLRAFTTFSSHSAKFLTWSRKVSPSPGTNCVLGPVVFALAWNRSGGSKVWFWLSSSVGLYRNVKIIWLGSFSSNNKSEEVKLNIYPLSDFQALYIIQVHLNIYLHFL